MFKSLPAFAIVGLPNVGKSTLFNALTRTRNALVANVPGVTRDRIYGKAAFEEKTCWLIDTGGLADTSDALDLKRHTQVEEAISEVDAILYIVDARAGLHAADLDLSRTLRKYNKPMLLVLNKTDGLAEDMLAPEFSALGFSESLPISAAHRRGLNTLLQAMFAAVPDKESVPEENPEDGRIVLSVLGRPNVGKSTLINALLKEDRVIVMDEAGTTLDSVFIPFDWEGEAFTFIDTAGLRRKARVKETLERFSALKALEAMRHSHVVLYVINARESVSEQDLHVLSQIIEAGKALVLLFNQCDGLTELQKEKLQKDIERRLGFVDFAEQHFISAKHGTGVGHLRAAALRAYREAAKRVSTSRLNQILKKAVTQHAPPYQGAFQIKLRYAHWVGHHPPTVMVHGTQTHALPAPYKRYLEGAFQKALDLKGTRLKLLFKNSDNPYAKEKR